MSLEICGECGMCIGGECDSCHKALKRTYFCLNLLWEGKKHFCTKKCVKEWIAKKIRKAKFIP